MGGLGAMVVISSVDLMGEIYMYQINYRSSVKMVGRLQFTTSRNALHGMHIHQFGDLSNGCISAGPHYNPFNQNHGSPTSKIRHVGDLGNISVDENGVSIIRFCAPKSVTLFGENSIYGRAVVVHALTDDLGRGGNEESLRTGNAGMRIGCAVIGRAPFQIVGE